MKRKLGYVGLYLLTLVFAGFGGYIIFGPLHGNVYSERPSIEDVSVKLRGEVKEPPAPAELNYLTYCVPYKGSDCKRT